MLGCFFNCCSAPFLLCFRSVDNTWMGGCVFVSYSVANAGGDSIFGSPFRLIVVLLSGWLSRYVGCVWDLYFLVRCAGGVCGVRNFLG